MLPTLTKPGLATNTAFTTAINQTYLCKATTTTNIDNENIRVLSF